MPETETVHDRVSHLTTAVSIPTLLTALALGASLAFALAFLQEPLVHDAVHNFRHGAGITCH